MTLLGFFYRVTYDYNNIFLWLKVLRLGHARPHIFWRRRHNCSKKSGTTFFLKCGRQLLKCWRPHFRSRNVDVIVMSASKLEQYLSLNVDVNIKSSQNTSKNDVDVTFGTSLLLFIQTKLKVIWTLNHFAPRGWLATLKIFLKIKIFR